jgi:hypothetical protein
VILFSILIQNSLEGDPHHRHMDSYQKLFQFVELYLETRSFLAFPRCLVDEFADSRHHFAQKTFEGFVFPNSDHYF